MSHIATYGTSLGQVNIELLNQAFEIVSEKFNGKTTDFVDDYYGKKLTEWDGATIIKGIKTPTVRRGIGVTIKNRVLQFVGDDYGCSREFAQLRGEIELTYKKLALAQALQELGYEINVESKEIGTVFHGKKV